MIDTFSSITNTDTYTQRLIHARGYWFAGTFRGASSQRLTDSTIFDGRRWPMKIRFSGTLGGLHGHDASTGDQGFGIRIDADNNRSFDLTAFTLPVFFVRRAADMVDFFRATKSNTRTGQPDEAKLRRYLQQHPESVPALRLAATKAPSSLAALTYHAVHTFGLSAQGRLTWARLTIEPYAPPQRRIEMQEALSLPANYLQQELESRLPVWFTVFAQLPTETDLLHDPTQPWSGNGGRVKLATIAIESAVSGDDPHSGFDPLNIDTLVPPLDELFADRHALYLMSRRRRSLA
ncbi:catalase [Mycobacteroides abscessus]